MTTVVIKKQAGKHTEQTGLDREGSTVTNGHLDLSPEVVTRPSVGSDDVRIGMTVGIPALGCVMVTLPYFRMNSQYKLMVDDDVGHLTHYLKSIDTVESKARLLIANEAAVTRMATVYWL